MRATPRRVARAAAAFVLLTVVSAGCAPARDVAVTPAPTPAPPAANGPVAPPDLGKRAAALAGKLSDVDLVGQVLMPNVNMSDPPAAAANLVATYRLGGVIAMSRTAGTTAAQARALTDAVRAVKPNLGEPVDLLIGTDQEYGWVTRIQSGIVQLPSAMAFGAAGRPDLTEAAWRGAGQELAALGINLDFAPDADVLGPPDNEVIGSRSYGSDPAIVAPQVAAAVRALQSAGVAASLKHFPGHGNTDVNSHTALPVLSQSRDSLNARDLPPFRSGIQAGAWMVMVGHLDVQAVDPGLPATFSHKVMVDLLRGELGFTGVVVTDALDMEPAERWPAGEAAVKAMVAGADLLLMPPDLAAARQGLLDGLASGALPRARLIEAVTRILTLKYRLAGIARPDMSTVDSPDHAATALAAAAAGVTVLRGPCSGPLVPGPVSITSSGGRADQVAWLTEALRQRGVTVVASGGYRVHLVGYGDDATALTPDASVTVAMDTPFVLAAATSPVRLATYSSSKVAMQALAAVLAGAARATGKDPVTVAGLPASACSGAAG